ncbi:E3 ubiquitin-protein ligase DCST1 [Diretmus argenteus]
MPPEAPPAPRRLKPPHSTLERLSLWMFPASVHRFLFSQSDEFPAARRLLGALTGAVSGAVLFLGLVHNLPLTSDFWLAAGGLTVGVCILGGTFSSFFRCLVLLTFPSMLGSRGRAYLMLLIITVLYRGPISNMQRNIQGGAEALGCNLDLQLNHSKLIWREAMEPFIQITRNIMDDNAEFQEEARSVSRKFQSIRDEVVVQYGYDGLRPKPAAATNSTQEQFTTKTRMQCDNVVEQGVQRCADWFQVKWQECMETIKVPVISHILCVSMKFHFLCGVMRVMTPWCREQIPVEGNFGQMFDKLNLSIDLLSREFSTDVVLQGEQQSVLADSVLQDEYSQALRTSFQEVKSVMEKILDILQLLLSFTFITIFISAFGYARRYRQDIRYDNMYITTYFRLMDARRRRAGQCCLLPLREEEKGNFIDPWSPTIHPTELEQVMAGLFQFVSVAVLSFVLLAMDLSLFHMLDIINRHTFTQFNFTSSHSVDMEVGGASMMARLLRKTITAFNTSSSLNMHTHNQMCEFPPSSLSGGVYVFSVCSVLLVALFCCVQVYANRLRRVITAFYYPTREKRRVSFLYNLHIQRRISSDRKRISGGRRTVGH